MCTYCANLKRFYLGKKKKKNKTKKQRKDKSRKRQKVGHGREKGNFVQHILPHFLPILERLNCGGPKEKMAGPHHFSLPLSLSSKHPSHQFSLLFSTLFFPSSLKSTHPNMLTSHTTQVTKCNTMWTSSGHLGRPILCNFVGPFPHNNKLHREPVRDT